MRDATDQMYANAQAGGQTVSPHRGALLMIWYADVNYNANDPDNGISDEIFAGGLIGGGDTCDSAGYRLVPDNFWEQNLSSAKGSGNCTVARFENIQENFAKQFNLPVDWVGPDLNDNVGVIHVWNG